MPVLATNARCISKGTPLFIVSLGKESSHAPALAALSDAHIDGLTALATNTFDRFRSNAALVSRIKREFPDAVTDNGALRITEHLHCAIPEPDLELILFVLAADAFFFWQKDFSNNGGLANAPEIEQHPSFQLLKKIIQRAADEVLSNILWPVIRCRCIHVVHQFLKAYGVAEEVIASRDRHAFVWVTVQASVARVPRRRILTHACVK
jgi:hypothetical protein